MRAAEVSSPRAGRTISSLLALLVRGGGQSLCRALCRCCPVFLTPSRARSCRVPAPGEEAPRAAVGLAAHGAAEQDKQRFCRSWDRAQLGAGQAPPRRRAGGQAPFLCPCTGHGTWHTA